MIAWLASLLAAVTLVGAWLYPGTSLCVALGWTTIPLFFVALVEPQRRMLRLFVAGVITYIGGFYWLLSTIRDFGGMPLVPALGVFLFFAIASSVQFLIWAFSFARLPRWCARWGLRTAISWLIAQHFWIAIFPWDFGHTQIEFVPFAQLAGIAGVTGITFVMMWLAEALCARRSASSLALPLALITFGGCLSYGFWVREAITKTPSDPLTTVMIQGNVTLQRGNGMTYFTVDRERYLRASAIDVGKDPLIIWPESTITSLVPDNATQVSNTRALPYFGNGSAFLVGGVTYRSENEYFNSSILIRPDGSLEKPYHKMILMPFGEYTPLGTWLPWLREINHTAGNFIAGTETQVLSYTRSDGRVIRLSPLICYEDIVPKLAQRATALGAELLVNQTNDVWFGDSVAPHQHHMIASFRAIENRRFLLRSTNTGLTAVVDPLGRTLAKLLPYTEATLPMEVGLLQYSSAFTHLPIPLFWFLCALSGAIVVIKSAIKRV